MKITRLFTALALLTSCFTLPALAQETRVQATITAATGSVQVSRNGTSRRATAGLKLAEGAVVSTGNDGQVSIQVHEGIVAVAARNTKVEIERLNVSSNGTRNALLNLLTGDLATSLDPSRKSLNNYGVRTAKGVALARGTTMTVSIDDKVCTVSVLVGNVIVNWDDGISVSIVGATPSDMTSSLGGQVRTESLAAALAANSLPGLTDAFAAAAAAVGTVATNPVQVTSVIEAIAALLGNSPAASLTLATVTASAIGAAVVNPALTETAGGTIAVASTITAASITAAGAAGNGSASPLILSASFGAVANALPGTDGTALAHALILASNSVPGNPPLDASLLLPSVGQPANPNVSPNPANRPPLVTTPITALDTSIRSTSSE